MSEVSNGQFFILINNDKSDFIKCLSTYSAAQKEFFHLLIEEIVNNPDESLTLSMTKALNLTPKVSVKFTKMEANNFIDVLLDEKWIENVFYFF